MGIVIINNSIKRIWLTAIQINKSFTTHLDKYEYMFSNLKITKYENTVDNSY